MKNPTHPQQGAFNIDKARAEAAAANERRKQESIREKQAIRLALISRNTSREEKR